MHAFCTQRLQGEVQLAWSRAAAVDSVQQHLDSTFARLQSRVQVDDRNVDYLVAAVALLCGALYPLSLRASELAAQRNLLAAQLQQFDVFKQQVMCRLFWCCIIRHVNFCYVLEHCSSPRGSHLWCSQPVPVANRHISGRYRQRLSQLFSL